MGCVLFAGHDTPRACLYDSVRDRTPKVESSQAPGWLVQTVQACLLKDWRQRLQFVSWESFREPTSAPDAQQQEKRIRVRQMRNEEMRQAAAKQTPKAPGPTREQQLWQLNSALVLEIRTYLLGSSVLPRCSVNEESVSQREYVTRLEFERDPSRAFHSDVTFTMTVSIDATMEQATKLTFEAIVEEQTLTTAAWTEMFTVESAFAACQRSFLDAAESLLLIGEVR
jgi:eukaryotic-like serine/threonine-protein kinase